MKVSIMDESANPSTHFLIPANCILPAFFYMMMDTSIQAYGMVTKGKEKLTTKTERSIRDNGIEKIRNLRDMELELYTLQTEKYSNNASGGEMSMMAWSNAKLFTFMPQLCFINFAVLSALK